MFVCLHELVGHHDLAACANKQLRECLSIYILLIHVVDLHVCMAAQPGRAPQSGSLRTSRGEMDNDSVVQLAVQWQYIVWLHKLVEQTPWSGGLCDKQRWEYSVVQTEAVGKRGVSRRSFGVPN